MTRRAISASRSPVKFLSMIDCRLLSSAPWNSGSDVVAAAAAFGCPSWLLCGEQDAASSSSGSRIEPKVARSIMPPLPPCWRRRSGDFGDHPHVPLIELVVIAMPVRPLGQMDRIARDHLVGNEREDVGDAVEPRPLLVVALQHVPGRFVMVAGLQHGVARQRIIVPARIGFDVHRAELPLPERILHPRAETALLLLLADLEPQLDQDDPVADEPLLEE